MKIFNLTLICYGEFRIWEDTKGNVLEAEFITMNGSLVLVRERSGKEREFNPSLLCEADHQYLEKVLPPKLSIDVSKTTEGGTSRSKGEAVRCLVSLKQTDTRAYKGELTAVLVVMGESIRTGAKQSVGKKEHVFTLPDDRGQLIEFSSDTEKFNGNKNKSGNTYSGYLLVVWDRFGNPVAVESNRTEFEKRAKALASPGSRRLNT
jgi:hypothetical protein